MLYFQCHNVLPQLLQRVTTYHTSGVSELFPQMVLHMFPGGYKIHNMRSGWGVE